MPRSYTWGSADGIQAAINSLPERYPMTLNADDMEALIRSLAYTADSNVCEQEQYVNHSDHDYDDNGDQYCLDDCWRMRAQSIVGSIAETLGVEWI